MISKNETSKVDCPVQATCIVPNDLHCATVLPKKRGKGRAPLTKTDDEIIAYVRRRNYIQVGRYLKKSIAKYTQLLQDRPDEMEYKVKLNHYTTKLSVHDSRDSAGYGQISSRKMKSLDPEYQRATMLRNRVNALKHYYKNKTDRLVKKFEDNTFACNAQASCKNQQARGNP